MRKRYRTPKSALGRCVYAFRVMRGMSFDDIAFKTGLSKCILSRLENQQSPNPCYATLRKMAEAFGVTMESFLVSLATYEKK